MKEEAERDLAEGEAATLSRALAPLPAVLVALMMMLEQAT